jgi:hypothetical protein
MNTKVISTQRLTKLGSFIKVGDPTPFGFLLVPQDFHYGFKLESLPDLEVRGIFDGDKLQITQLKMASGEGITATQLIQIKLPDLLRLIALDAIPDSQHWAIGAHLSDSPLEQKTELYPYIAQAYWFHHLSWGAPRLFIMEFMGWSRNNTNFHLKKISQTLSLPSSRENKTVVADRPDSNSQGLKRTTS